MPGALQLPCYVLALAEDAKLDYEGAVLMGMECGGCSASRCAFIGACMAAAGLAPPTAWVGRTLCAEEVLKLGGELVGTTATLVGSAADAAHL